MTHPRPKIEVLPNGLTLIMAPSVTAGVATVAVHVGVGFRSEPADCSGMAHLFEHLMFAGSSHVEPGGHFTAIESVGGRVGGHTRHDYTEFFDVVPSSSLVNAVGLEADRLTGPRLDATTMGIQVDVIRAEIAQQIHGAPYGGFPWLHLPQVMYSTSANTHDGYGDVQALAQVTVADAAEFRGTWYAPENVVVTLEGDLGSPASIREAQRLLEQIPRASRKVPTTEIKEPWLSEDRHQTTSAANVPLPVWAVGFRLPDPVRSPDLYAACSALTMLLPVHAPAMRLTARCGWYGIPADAHSPDALVFSTYPKEGVTAGQLTDAMRELLSEWRAESSTPQILNTAADRLRLQQYYRSERDGHRARRLGASHLLFKDAELDAAIDPAEALDRDLLAGGVEFLLNQSVASVLVQPTSEKAAV